MSITISKPTLTDEAKKTRNLYDNYDNLISVVKYDNFQNVEYVLKPNNNTSGKSIETTKFQQVQVDVVEAASNITGESAVLKARVYKNENSKVYETGFVYWIGSANDSIIGKQAAGNVFVTPNVFKGNFSNFISNLQDTTTYNYRAYVVHEYGVNYSKAYQFTTVDFTSIFQIAGQRYSGTAPFTLTLSAINAGFGDYTYGWNMTGGPIVFKYSLDSINVTFSGAGYTDMAQNYSLNSVTMTVTGFGYDNTAKTNVLVNGLHFPDLSANFQRETFSFGVSSVSVPVPLSGFKITTLNVTFSSSNDSNISTVASGVGVPGIYEVKRENAILVDGTYQPSLSVVVFRNEDTGIFGVSAIKFLSGPLSGYANDNRTVILSSNGPVNQGATIKSLTSIQIIADYTTRVTTHTYLCAGNYTPKVYAIFGDQIQKEATRVIRVNNTTNFTPQWNNFLNTYANTTVAAYDFRNWAGTVDTIDLNEYPIAQWGFEPDSITINARDVNARNMLADGLFTGATSSGGVGGYLYRTNIGYNSLGGYDYSRLFAPGLNGGQAARFDSQVITGQVGGYGAWANLSPLYIFNNSQPFTISLWINYEQFETPGTRILSVVPLDWWNSKEWGITQSPTELSFFKNIPFSEQNLSFDPIAGYRAGFPVLSTNDPSKMLTPKVWNHMAITRSSTNDYKYYLNGVLALSGTGHLGGYSPQWAQYIFNNAAFSTALGGYTFLNLGSTRYYNTTFAPPSGLMDSVAMWGKELSQAEVEELYYQNGSDEFGYLTPIVGPKLWLGGLVGDNAWGNFGDIKTRPETTGDSLFNDVTLLLKFEGTNGSLNFVDSSSYNRSLSSSGARISTTQKRFGNSSGLFADSFTPGPSGYIQTLSSSDHALFRGNDFTIEWFEYIHLNSNQLHYPIFFYGNPGTASFNNNVVFPLSPTVSIRYVGGNLDISVGGYQTSFGHNWNGNNFKGRWTHNAVTRRVTSPSQCTLSWYRDGVLAGYANTGLGIVNRIGGYGDQGPTAELNGTGSIGGGYIGGYFANISDFAWRYFDGFIDELRITNGEARYGANFVIPASAYPTERGTNIATRFTPGRNNSFAAAKASVPVTYPHTIAFIGNIDVASTSETSIQGIQGFLYGGLGGYYTVQQAIRSYGSSFGGLQPLALGQIGTYSIAGNNINTNAAVGPIVPLGGYQSEWMYLAYSFLGPTNNWNVRYHLKTPTVSGQGIVGGYNNALQFNGFPIFGHFGNTDPVAGYSPINGLARLGVYMNQGFTTHSDMLNLFVALTSGPGAGIPL